MWLVLWLASGSDVEPEDGSHNVGSDAAAMPVPSTADVPHRLLVADGSPPTSGLGGFLLRDASGTPLVDCDYWLAAEGGGLTRPPPERVRSTDGNGAWLALASETGPGRRWLVMSPHSACFIEQELPEEVASATQPLSIVVPMAKARCTCIGLPPGAQWRAHAYPLAAMDSVQTLQFSRTVAGKAGMPPLRVTQWHLDLGSTTGDGALELESVEGTVFEIAFFAAGHRLSGSMQRGAVPSGFIATAVGVERGFLLRIEEGSVPESCSGQFVVDDGSRRMSDVLPMSGAFVSTQGLGDEASVSVRRDDGATCTIRVGLPDAERLGLVTLPATGFVPPLVLQTEKDLVGLLLVFADGSGVRQVPASRHVPADHEVLIRRADGQQVATQVLQAVRQRIVVAADGNVGEVDTAGLVSWGRSQSRRIRPSQVWTLPPLTKSLHVSISVGLPPSTSVPLGSWIDLRDLECAPDAELDVIVNLQLAVCRMNASAVTPSGLVPLPVRILE